MVLHIAENNVMRQGTEIKSQKFTRYQGIANARVNHVSKTVSDTRLFYSISVLSSNSTHICHLLVHYSEMFHTNTLKKLALIYLSYTSSIPHSFSY
jgi:hypothetical protein